MTTVAVPQMFSWRWMVLCHPAHATLPIALWQWQLGNLALAVRGTDSAAVAGGAWCGCGGGDGGCCSSCCSRCCHATALPCQGCLGTSVPQCHERSLTPPPRPPPRQDDWYAVRDGNSGKIKGSPHNFPSGMAAVSQKVHDAGCCSQWRYCRSAAPPLTSVGISIGMHRGCAQCHVESVGGMP